MIPAESSPSRLFTKLFIADSPADRRHQMYRAREGRSIMDVVADDTRSIKRRVGVGDRDRLDAYFTSVRDLEKRLASSEAWVNKPKPNVKVSKPLDIANPSDFIARQRLMSDMIRLALATDSSRYVVCHFGSGSGVVPLDGVEEGYHTLSHHGLDEEKLSQLAIVEKAIVDSWGDFLRSLKDVDERGESILDTTSVLLTSNLGKCLKSLEQEHAGAFCRWWFSSMGNILRLIRKRTTRFRICIFQSCSRLVFRQNNLPRQLE